MSKVDNDKIQRLNAQHQKESSVYDADSNWNTAGEKMTEEDVDEISSHFDKNKTIALDVATGTGRVVRDIIESRKY